MSLTRFLDFLHFLAQFFPPDHSWSYLKYLGEPILQTIAMGVGSIFIAALIAFPLGVIIGTKMPGWRIVYAALAAVRSIPDLTMAILCVVIVGIGLGAGLIALILYYSAAMGKLFGEMFLSADPAPLDALRATGASRLSLAGFGLIPLKLNDTISYSVYELESAMRCAVIVGAAGAGGLGTELVGSINNFDYQRVTTLILVIVLLITLMDRFCWLVKKIPVVAIVLVPAAIWSVIYCWPHFFAAQHAREVFTGMWPPKLNAKEVHALPVLILQTLGMAAGGTFFAAMVALPCSVMAARGVAAPRLIIMAIRRVLDLARAIPEVIWGLLLIMFIRTGMVVGIIALALHSTGVLGKLFAESLENVPTAPIQALNATGASRISVAAFGHLPLAFKPIAVHSLFRLEWNVRAATVVGIIGAGGIGEALFENQQLFFYHQMLSYLLVTLVLVGILDLASNRLRNRYEISWKAME